MKIYFSFVGGASAECGLCKAITVYIAVAGSVKHCVGPVQAGHAGRGAVQGHRAAGPRQIDQVQCAKCGQHGGSSSLLLLTYNP